MFSGLQPYSNHVLRQCLKACWTYATNCKMGFRARALGSDGLTQRSKRRQESPDFPCEAPGAKVGSPKLVGIGYVDGDFGTIFEFPRWVEYDGVPLL